MFNEMKEHEINNKLAFKADKEILEIFNKTYPELIESVINISIKKFSETSEYKKYFLKKEYRDEELSNSDSSDVSDNEVSNTSEKVSKTRETPQESQTSNVSDTNDVIDLSSGW